MKFRNEAPSVKLNTVATFPKHYFLENLAVRSDNSVLVTVLNHQELWYVPASNDQQPVEPQLLFTFSHPASAFINYWRDGASLGKTLRPNGCGEMLCNYQFGGRWRAGIHSTVVLKAQ